ncbi:MAG: hypothetical protein RLQ73_17980 [Hoeflea sp. D1-CHI-28]
MLVSTMTRGLCTASAAIAMTIAAATSAKADTITVTDIAGRTVEVEQDPDHIVLGEVSVVI